MNIYYTISVLMITAVCFSLLKEGRTCAGIRPSASTLNLVAFKYIVYAMFTALTPLLWFLTACRAGNIGNDTYVYLRAFQDNRIEVNPLSRMEAGFKFICYIVGRFTVDGNIFLLVIATASYVALYVVILKRSDNPLFSICLVFTTCFSSMTNQLRQSIAAIICI